MRNSALVAASALFCAFASAPACAVYLTTAVSEASGAPFGTLFVGDDYTIVVDMQARPTAQFDYKTSRTSIYDYYIGSVIDYTSFASFTSQFDKYKYVVASPSQLTISFEPDSAGVYSFDFQNLIVETRSRVGAEKQATSDDGFTSFDQKIVPDPLTQGPLSCSFDQTNRATQFTTTAQCALTFTVEQKSAAVMPVPEPATWALMLSGFGLLGTALRRSPRASADRL